jgi:uncharacterized membrane protein YbaN (DUF454 family)
LKRRLYQVAGLISVALGIIGAFLPLLPTVPFLILAAFCFARSNPEWEARLLNHPRYGPTLRRWREKGAVSRKAKLAASGAFAVSIAMGFAFLDWPLSLIPLGVALTCGGWLWMRPEG